MYATNEKRVMPIIDHFGRHTKRCSPRWLVNLRDPLPLGPLAVRPTGQGNTLRILHPNGGEKCFSNLNIAYLARAGSEGQASLFHRM